MTSRARFFPQVFAAILTATFAGTGCNFILNPANSDEVVRCKNTTECEQEEKFFEVLGTNRVDAACSAPGGGGGGFTSSMILVSIGPLMTSTTLRASPFSSAQPSTMCSSTTTASPVMCLPGFLCCDA